ncbi:hypothetical protein COV18_01310 [Candidatus Woesearchaeota archaeon CG10_big_fil_rev_8_21_14_0_10_37_12]|nr:MAG: hypothetical protein COV18_01310 [Candidatus Woesearchaeota archaeon CG10_big_fil_rev_8_21_14_0_10_37_12]
MSETLKLASLREAKVRLATPTDAEAIAEIFQQTYGDRYPFKEYYDPERWTAMLAETGAVSFVAEFQKEIVGHGGLYFSDTNPVEFRRTAIKPGARGERTSYKLLRQRQLHALSKGRAVFTSELVTSHIGSQKTLENEGFLPVGILFGIYADMFGVGQKETIVPHYWDPYGKLRNDEERRIYVPDSARELVDYVCASMQLPRAISEGDALPSRGTTRINRKTDVISHRASIITESPGTRGDLEAQLRTQTDILEREGATYIHADVNLQHVCAPDVINALEEFGYFPAAYLPAFEGGEATTERVDVLRMTKITNSIDEKLLKLTPKSRTLVNTVAKHKNFQYAT